MPKSSLITLAILSTKIANINININTTIYTTIYLLSCGATRV